MIRGREHPIGFFAPLRMTTILKPPFFLIRAIFAFGVALPAARAVTVVGEILDAASGQPIPARLSIRGADGKWHPAKSAAPAGTAIRYERQRANTTAVENHTTLSAHPFQAELPPGRYTFTAARGKEYVAETRDVTIAPGTESPKLAFRLRRWTDMAREGWYSGDTHVHRTPAELANLLLAEDLNVALPLLDWTTDSSIAPTADPRSLGGQVEAKLVTVDATHVWYPRNTEFEIFRVANQPHRLGAFFVLNHRARFERPLFPVAAVIAQARANGALLDLEKHNWEWTIAMAPILKPDVVEIANNHMWQTDYVLKDWAVPAPAWMKFSGSGTDNERDWVHYGFHSYYALLNCGLRIAPTAGSANGVHPVPLGFSRVYVHLDGPLDYDAWIRGLAAGRSFVTTGPMLRATANRQWPGATFNVTAAENNFDLHCAIRSEHPLDRIELIVNGEIAETFSPANKSEADAFTSEVTTRHRPGASSWIAWRCFETRPAGRFRFAHTAPWYLNVPDQALRPRRVEVEWLITRVKDEIARSRDIVPRDFLAEYERALKFYESLAASARN